MTTQTLIAPTTAVAQSGAITISREQLPVTLIAADLDGSEAITVQFSVDGGATKIAAAQDGAAVQLVVLNNVLTIRSPIVVSVSKPVTVNAVGVFLSSGVDPERAI